MQRTRIWVGGIVLAAGLAACSDDSGGGAGATAAPVSSSSGSAPTTSSSTTPPPPQRQAPANLHTGPELVLDTSGAGDFFDWPWPLDARRDASGHPDLSGLPLSRNFAFIRKVYETAEEADGFSPTGTIYLRFDGPLTAPPDDPIHSVSTASDVLLVDVDPASPFRLERHPFHARVTQQADAVRPADLLQLRPVPGLGLRPHTTYAAIALRRLGAPGAAWLGQHPDLTQLLAGREPSGSRGIALAQAFAPLPAALRDLGIHPDDVAAATVFTTGDPTADLTRQVQHVAALPPLQPAGQLAVRDVFPTFTALAGEYDVPQYQAGTKPFPLDGGEIVTDAQGNPLARHTDRAKFQLSIPKGVMPPTGFPLVFYCHGTGGQASQVIDRGRFSTPTTPPPLGSGPALDAARQGWAAACATGPFTAERLGVAAADGYAAYNFFNARAMRDNFKQMLFELAHFRSLLLDLRIDPALCPGTDASASPDGKVFFDPDLLVVRGQSLGSYLSGMLAATLPGWKGAVLTGAGGSWVEFAFGPKVPVRLEDVLQLVVLPPGERLDRFHPLIMAFDLGVGPADNTHYLRHVLREPLPGHTPPHVLVIEGHEDLQVATGLQRALVLALGVDLGGQDVGPRPEDRIEPVLAWTPQQALPFPITGNVQTPAGPRTGVVVRYLEDGIREGHYVSQQLDAPKRQFEELLADLKRGVTPTVR